MSHHEPTAPDLGPAPRVATRVEALVTAELVDEQGSGARLAALMAYDAEDPWAVSACFPVTGGTVVWTFARSLLASGVFDPVGDGDVHVWPCLATDGRAVTILELHGETGPDVCVQLPSEELLAFLGRTEAVVAPGAESAHVDLDRLCDELLAPRD